MYREPLVLIPGGVGAHVPYSAVAEPGFIVTAALLRRADGVRRREDPADAAVQVLERADGQVAIADLARTVGVGRRRLERHFLDRVGLAPKRLARILRLQALLRCLDGENPIDWAVLAVAGDTLDVKLEGMGADAEQRMEFQFTRVPQPVTAVGELDRVGRVRCR